MVLKEDYTQINTEMGFQHLNMLKDRKLKANNNEDKTKSNLDNFYNSTIIQIVIQLNNSGLISLSSLYLQYFQYLIKIFLGKSKLMLAICYFCIICKKTKETLNLFINFLLVFIILILQNHFLQFQFCSLPNVSICPP